MEKNLYYYSDTQNIGCNIQIEIKDTQKPRLSIMATVFEGKKLWKNEHNLICAGQSLDHCRGIVPDRLLEIWERWHLNDMRAGCEHQRDGWLGKKCETYGYEYGSAWLYEPLPSDVIEYLNTL